MMPFFRSSHPARDVNIAQMVDYDSMARIIYFHGSAGTAM
jgi:hypothetical protein